MLSFEGSCIAMLALYGALMLLVKLLSTVGMVKSLLRQEKPKSGKPEAQEPLMKAVASSGAAASSSAAAASAAAGEPAGVVNAATSEWPRVNAVKEVFVSPHGSKFHTDRQCQYLRGKVRVASYGVC